VKVLGKIPITKVFGVRKGAWEDEEKGTCFLPIIKPPPHATPSGFLLFCCGEPDWAENLPLPRCVWQRKPGVRKGSPNGAACGGGYLSLFAR